MAAYPGVRSPAFARAAKPPPFRVLRILDGYVLRELAGPFAFALAAFFLFWFANIFVLAADYLVNKGASIFLVLRFLTFRVPQATPLAFPFACLFGTLLGMGRLAADNEISAMRTSGVPFRRIIRLPLIAGAAVALLSFYVNEKVAPVTTDLSTRSFYQIIYKTQSLPIEPNIFRADPSSGKTYYIQSVAPDGKTMENVMIFEPDRTSPLCRRSPPPRAPTSPAPRSCSSTRSRRTIKPDGNVSAVDAGGAQRDLLAADGRQRPELPERRLQRHLLDGLQAAGPGHQVPQADRPGRHRSGRRARSRWRRSTPTRWPRSSRCWSRCRSRSASARRAARWGSRCRS